MQKDFNFFLLNQEELVKKFQGKYLVIKDEAILGVYSTEEEAITTTAKEHEIGTFLVQLVEPGTESYTQTFHSRVIFA